jgi:GxxExxY protein
MSTAAVQADQLNAITEQIIGAAMEVHRALGPGLLESAYEACLVSNFASAAYVSSSRSRSRSRTKP